MIGVGVMIFVFVVILVFGLFVDLFPVHHDIGLWFIRRSFFGFWILVFGSFVDLFSALVVIGVDVIGLMQLGFGCSWVDVIGLM